MTTRELVTAAGMRLVPADPEDRPDVIALQQAAYAANRKVLGVEPIPLLADYDEIFAAHEVWLIRAAPGYAITAALFLKLRADDLLIWSVATAPGHQGGGLGNALLEAAEIRARELGRDCIRLYTGQKLTARVAWYQRHGYAIERLEELADRTSVHMVKSLTGALGGCTV